MPEYKSTPPAFPQTGDTLIGDGKGMTLRDYFAGQALNGWFTTWGGARAEAKPDAVSRLAYEIADAMLKERAK